VYSGYSDSLVSSTKLLAVEELVGDRILDRASSAGFVAAEVVMVTAERDEDALPDRASLGSLLVIGVVLAPEAEARNEDAIPDQASSDSLVAAVVVAALAFSDISVSSGCVKIAINT